MKLGAWTTLGLGGEAKRTFVPQSRQELLEFLSNSNEFRVLGGGSNLVVGDSPIEEVVLVLGDAYAGTTAIDRGAEVHVSVEAGHNWDRFVEYAIAQGWTGLAALSGIPGTVGATPIQNVGAYGREVGDVLHSVEVWDRKERAVCTFSREECMLSYRHSRFREDLDRFVILQVTFELKRSAEEPVPPYAEVARALADCGAFVASDTLRRTVLSLRASKGMVYDPADPETHSAGSFFTNPILSQEAFQALRKRFVERGGDPETVPHYPAPEGHVKVAAAWLIEKSGFSKGYSLGARVRISKKHTLALVHEGGGSTEDLLLLARAVRDGVRAAFHVELRPEPVFWNCSL